MQATLDAADAGALPSQLPPLWHWLYFLPGERQSKERRHAYGRADPRANWLCRPAQKSNNTETR